MKLFLLSLIIMALGARVANAQCTNVDGAPYLQDVLTEFRSEDDYFQAKGKLLEAFEGTLKALEAYTNRTICFVPFGKYFQWTMEHSGDESKWVYEANPVGEATALTLTYRKIDGDAKTFYRFVEASIEQAIDEAGFKAVR